MSRSSRSEPESHSAASTAELLRNSNRSQDNFSHVEYGRQYDPSAAGGDPWRTDLDEATLQELFQVSPRGSKEICPASKAGQASSDSVEDAADALQRITMALPLWAPIVGKPEISEDQQRTRIAAGQCEICRTDLFYMCLPLKCPLRNRWSRRAVASKVFARHTDHAERYTPQDVCESKEASTQLRGRGSTRAGGEVMCKQQ